MSIPLAWMLKWHILQEDVPAPHEDSEQGTKPYEGPLVQDSNVCCHTLMYLGLHNMSPLEKVRYNEAY